MSGRRIIIVMGPPGSGKSTLTETLAKTLHMPMCSPSRWMQAEVNSPHSTIGAYMRNNERTQGDMDRCACDYVTKLVDSSVKTSTGVVIDGFPETEYQLSRLARVLNNVKTSILFIDTPSEFVDLRPLINPHAVRNLSAPNLDEAIDVLRTHPGHIMVYRPTSHARFSREKVDMIEAAETLTICQRETNSSRTFPGVHPVSLLMSHLSTLAQTPYVVSKKLDGERSLMVIVEGFTRLMNRGGHVTRMAFNEHLLKWGICIIDVELVGTATCVVLDALIVRGCDVRPRPLLDRMASVADLILDISPMFHHGAHAQRYIHISEVRQLYSRNIWNGVTGLCDATYDGLVFTPLRAVYRVQRDAGWYKWKPMEHNTVDLLVGDDKTLWSVNRSHTDRVACGVIGTNSAPSQYPLTPGTIVECLPLDEETDPMKWRVVRIRRDRRMPNADFIVRRILSSIRENITISTIFSLPNVM